MMPPSIGENHSQAAHPLAGPITKRRSAANWKLRMIGGGSFSTKQEIICTSPLSYIFYHLHEILFQSFLLILRIPYPARIEPPKLPHNVARCRTKSRDAQGNMCYNVNCQRRIKEHTLPGANAPKSCHRMSPKVARQTSQYVL